MFSKIPKLPFYFDPYFLFCVFGIVIPPLRLGYSLKDTIDYFLNDYMIACFFVGVLVVFVTHTFRGRENALVRLNSFDTWRARWYLLTGVTWHLYFDGLVGAFKVNKASAVIAGLVDKRYAAPLFEKEGAGIHTICLIELCIMSSLCFLSYFAFYRRKSWRATAEVATSSFQIMGTIAWILEEYLTGFHSFFEYEKKFELTEARLTYFWFGTVFGAILYIAVPLLCIVTAAQQTETIVPAPSRSPSLAREVVHNNSNVNAAAVVAKNKSETPARKSTSRAKKNKN